MNFNASGFDGSVFLKWKIIIAIGIENAKLIEVESIFIHFSICNKRDIPQCKLRNRPNPEAKSINDDDCQIAVQIHGRMTNIRIYKHIQMALKCINRIVPTH